MIAGLGRLSAARELGWEEAPCLIVSHLSDAEKRAYALADNRIAEQSDWDDEACAAEFAELANLDCDFDLPVTGFDLAEIEALIDDEVAPAPPEPPKPAEPTSQLGDVWVCGPHLVGCFDATKPASIAALAPDDTFAACVTDAPYNLKIRGTVTSKAKHREFVMASGEMTDAEFTDFLTESYGSALSQLKLGGLLYAAMDWRHMKNVLDAAERLELELANVCI